MLSFFSHRRVKIVVVALVVLGLGLIAVAPAFGHSELVSSDPPDGASLESAPSQVTLTFGAAVIGQFTEVRVSRDGIPIQVDPPASRDNVVSQPLPADAPGGSWVVTYKIVSADSHPVSGQVRFTVAGASPTPTTNSPTTDSPGTATAATPGAGEPSALIAPAPDSAAQDSSWPLWLGVGAGALLVLAGLAVLVRRRHAE